ncbi:oxidative damage protection protein [Candidatus Purcelliella pentastirinorum]|uniref:oxidative damage protection protein n=1 Tax=Candidatus Purcelliella pentastirinorum TaxID=472834 RepID=UPI00237BA5EB|nr:oxidative damage protection protein [Candidatus Purcelliella pentastirinorum]WDR80421.1 oxidative damage protection protein [Candidatus Purcelliella pentastirinorum]
MNNKIFCTFLKKKAKKQKIQFYPGKIGKLIYKNISQQAWEQWIKKQTILINENKLNMNKKKDREILTKEMYKYLFKNKT